MIQSYIPIDHTDRYQYHTSMKEDGRAGEIRRWKAEAVAEFEAAQANLAAAQQRVEASRERLRLLDRLLAVENGPETLTQERSMQANHQPTPFADDLLDACERLVRSAGRPLHIKELHAAVLKEGIPIPGRGTEANLLVRLHRSDGRFVRTGRGTYAPASMGVQEVRPTQRRRVSARSAK
jgi:hypothetical protein